MIKGQLIGVFQTFLLFVVVFSINFKKAGKALLNIYLLSVRKFDSTFFVSIILYEAADRKAKFKWFSGPTISISEYVQQVAAFDSLLL